MTALRRRRQPVRPGQGFSFDPPEGHRLADIEISMVDADRRAVCQCGEATAWWSTAYMAVEAWRYHAGADA